MDLTNYVKPELIVVAAVLCILGTAVKKTGVISCRYVPLLNGAAGIAICALYGFATTELSGAADIAMAVFTSVTQGILVTGLATVVCRVTGKDKNGTEGDNRKQEKEEKQTADDTQHSAVPENTKEQQDK